MSRSKILLISLFVGFFCFFSFLPSIVKNTIPFQTDEFYWIQTARILPYMLEGKTKDGYWKEHMGFTNFNGAKWTYALGLRMFGHTNFSSIGIPPFHYELWKKYDGQYFPTESQLYPLLQHGRIINAFFAGIAASFMFLFTYTVLPSIPAALAATFLLRFHPTFEYMATHAFADSMFLTYELMIYLIAAKIFQSRLKAPPLFYILLGIAIGLAVAVKINAAMFYIILIVSFIVWAGINDIRIRDVIPSILITTIVALNTFLILHPNFYFFPQYSIGQMVADRIEITQIHMAYFYKIDPPHVLFTIPQRLVSLYKNIFHPLHLPLFTLGTITSFILYAKRKKWHTPQIFFLQWANMYMITLFLLMYVVFNEQRYFLPVLPFVSLVSVSWIYAIHRYASFRGRY
jgi:hypothetical protein